MYLKKILTDGKNEFVENMRIEFDYKCEHFNVKIKTMYDDFFTSYDGRCFDYDPIHNCKIGYVVGEEVTVNVKALYESDLIVECGWINTKQDILGDVYSWILYNEDGLLCANEELCKIIAIKEDCIILKNMSIDTEFALTYDEANICCLEDKKF